MPRTEGELRVLTRQAMARLANAEAALKRSLPVINCPNEGGTLTQEYEHDLYDFGAHGEIDSGTGVVHTAPGHGAEDYIVWQQHFGHDQSGITTTDRVGAVEDGA